MALAPDGSLFLSDFYNDTSRGTNQVSGSIYRITRKDKDKLVLPQVDFSTIQGLLLALKNPAVNVRSHAAYLLSKKGKEAFQEIQDFLVQVSGEPVLEARALWILAQIGGRQEVEKFLGNEDDEKLQVVAYRALRHADPIGTLARAKQYADSKNLHLLREIAISLRGVPFLDCGSILDILIDGFDGRNRYYLRHLESPFTEKRIKSIINLLLLNIQSLLTGNGELRILPGVPYRRAVKDLDVCIRAQKSRLMNSVFLPWHLPVFEMIGKKRTGKTIKVTCSVACL